MTTTVQRHISCMITSMKITATSPAVVYNDTYAVIPICRVFSDKNGQMFYKSKLNHFTYTNGQNITQLLFPSQIMSMKFKDIAAERETAVGLTYNGEVLCMGETAHTMTWVRDR